MKPTPSARLALACLFLAGQPHFLPAASLPTGQKVDFFHEIQPILRESCYSCHGPEKQKGGLRLDSKVRAFQGGEDGPAIVPGHSEQSPLVSRLQSAKPDERMPKKADPFSAEKIALVRAWIDQGANWPESVPVTNVESTKHWAFQPFQRKDPPTVTNSTWGRTPIDRFILAKLEAKQIQPNPPVDRRRLVRRAYFDLIGLPPKPEEVEAFVADQSADAYARLLDRLLASPHYGERWARHWLDTARFGESFGFEQDYDRPYAYWYRDFVIKAFNDGMPFDQFIQWQLAGDEFEPENPWAMAATGFIGAGVFPTQLTEAEFEPARYDELDNMASTTGTAMLGLTIGCARCHDHKFDPITCGDYYKFISIFGKTIRGNVELDFDPEKSRKERSWFDQKHTALVAARDWFEREQLPVLFDQWLKSGHLTEKYPSDWMLMDLDQYRSEGGATLKAQSDGSVLVSGKSPDHDTYVFNGHSLSTNLSAIRIEAMADPSFVKGGPGRAGNGNFQFTDLKVSAAPLTGEGASIEVKLTNPKATFEQNADLAVAKVVDNDPHTGWAVDPRFGTNHAAVFQFAEPVGFAGGVRLTVTMAFNGNQKHTIGRPRVSLAAGSVPGQITGEPTDEGILRLLNRLFTEGDSLQLNAAERAQLFGWYRVRDSAWQRMESAVREHLASAPKPATQKVMVTSEGVKPIPHHADDRGFPHFYPQTYFLKRGDTLQKGQEMTPGYLAVLTHSPEGDRHWDQPVSSTSHTSGRRRALAKWITDPKYGAGDLLARVAVNRLWQHHFGRGLVATPNDFGTQGARPTHPELLDWLAADLQDHGWNLQRLHRLIMTSAVYLQGGEQDPARAQVDPENQLLWHWERHRLEAEAIRDSLLSVSGQLDERLFGPGTLDESMRRRSIYFFVKRSEFIPLLQLFDAPDPSVSVGNRVSTTTAPQALLFLNNPNVRTYARALAARLESAAAKSPADAVSAGYRLVLGRAPTAVEVADATRFLEHQEKGYSSEHPADAGTLARADFCQVLFGLNEFIYLE